jgi:thymidylate synthase (FAD)
VKVVLLQSTPEPERLVALAARICYSPSTLADLAGEVERKDVRSLLARVLSMGHESVTEHASFTFGVEGISRAASHQLVRHRIASYSQQSQRYVAASFGYVTPVSLVSEGWRANRRGTLGIAKAYADHMQRSSDLYERLLKEGVPAEDARFVLPNATETRLLVTMNARELNHFLALRLCRRAQWEIRDVALEMLRLARSAAPLLFARSGPGCVHGKCPEGKFSCGEAARVRRELLPAVDPFAEPAAGEGKGRKAVKAPPKGASAGPRPGSAGAAKPPRTAPPRKEGIAKTGAVGRQGGQEMREAGVRAGARASVKRGSEG